MTEHVREGLLNDSQDCALLVVGQQIDVRRDSGRDPQRRARRETICVMLDRGLQPLERQILRMQQLRKGSNFPERFIDRCVDLLAKPLSRDRIAKAPPDPHQAQARSDQMLACRIVQIGRNPLLDILLNGRQIETRTIQLAGGRAMWLHGTHSLLR